MANASSDPLLLARWLAVPAPVHVDVSPDGDRIAVTVVSVPWGETEEQVAIDVVSTVSGVAGPLPAAVPGDRMATWAPDGGRLAFVTDRTGSAQVAVAPADGSDAEVVTSVPAGVAGPVSWSPDGDRIAFVAGRGRSVDRTRPWRVVKAFEWFDGIGLLDDPPQVWVLELGTGRCEMVTDDEWRWSLPRWSPDGRRIVAVASHDPTFTRLRPHLRIIEPDGTWFEPAIPGGLAVVAAWAPDGSLLALSEQPEGRPAGSEAQLHRLLPDGSIVRLDVDAPAPVGGSVYGDSAALVGEAFETVLAVSGDDVYVRTQRGGRMGVARHSLADGSWTELVAGDRCVSPFGVTRAGLVVSEQAADRFCRLAVIDTDPADPADPALRFLPSSVEVEHPPSAVVHRWTVPSPHDGAPLDAWHLRPAGVEGPLPTVLLIHGGPNAAFGEAMLLDAQSLCAAGFGVVYTNPHGSTGYGDPFSHAALDHWGDIPPADVLAVVDDAVARGWADPDRLGVTGNSYGGYLTCWLACTSDRFRAAVAENPVTDLLSMYGTCDVGVTFLPTQFGPTPLEDVGPYLRWSPLLRARDCHPPILFVSGTEDRRCPPTQAIEMHRALKAIGKVSEMLMLPDSSHIGTTFGPPVVRLAHDEALVDWMRRWLLDGP